MKRHDPKTKVSPVVPRKRTEVKVYGYRSVMALFKQRPEDIIRAYVTKNTLKTSSELLKWCASKKKAYHVVTAEELENILKSTHHEGIALIAQLPYTPTLTELLENIDADQPQLILALDGVKNPHNIGAIFRVAAHFGVTAIVSPSDGTKLSPALMRVAEGGCEFVPWIIAENFKGTLEVLKRREFTVIATSDKAQKSIYKYALPKKAVIIFGDEHHGVSDEVLEASQQRVCISGSDILSSLNVATAASVCASEFFRQHLFLG